MENNNAITQNATEFVCGSYYCWSFTARLHQAPENIAAYYNEIKNAFLRYKKVQSQISWSCDTITFGKEQLAKLVLTQKTLYVYLMLSPKELEGTNFSVTDVTSTKEGEKAPLHIRVRSDRGVKYTIELIEKIAASKSLQLDKDFEATDYTLPRETIEALLARQLIKKVNILEQNMESELEGGDTTPIEEAEDATPEEGSGEESGDDEDATKDETTIEQTPAEEIQNEDLLDAESIHVDFLRRICKQFDADELDAHVKVVYKRRREKKTSIFDIVMKKNRSTNPDIAPKK